MPAYEYTRVPWEQVEGLAAAGWRLMPVPPMPEMKAVLSQVQMTGVILYHLERELPPAGTVITAAQAHAGDVVRAPDGDVYQAPAGGAGGWSTMQPIGFFGDPAATAPAGDLLLLLRDGQPPQAAS